MSPIRHSGRSATRSSRTRPAGRGRARRRDLHGPSLQALLAATISFVEALAGADPRTQRELVRLRRNVRAGSAARRELLETGQLLGCGARLLRQWCNELPFVHPTTAAPRPLGFDVGQPCLAGLLKAHFPRMTPLAALAWMEEQGAIVRQADGCYAPVQRGNPLGLATEELVLRVIQCLEAGLHNLRADSSQRYPELAVFSMRVPERALPHFRIFSGKQLQYLNQTLVQWLADHEDLATTEPCRRVSIQSWVHVEEDWAAPRPRRQRARGD
jgi:hypothetical protein